jgi:hypothetical protein
MCGEFVLPERAEITADGLRCRNCSLRSAVETLERGRVEQAAATEALRRQLRIILVAAGHLIVWLGVIWLFYRSWEEASLSLAALVVALPLMLRKRWAFYVALALDVAGFVAPLVVTALADVDAGIWPLAKTLAAVPLILGALLYSLRDGFVASGAATPPPLTPPQPSWRAPGRQL